MKYIFLTSVLFSILSCNLFETNKSEPVGLPVLELNKQVLYTSDIEKILPEKYSKEDSSLVVNKFIDDWVINQLLLEKANINLTEEKILQINGKVKKYRDELLTQNYSQLLLQSKVDTIVSKEEITEFYQNNKNSFHTNKPWYKIRFLKLSPKSEEITEAKKIITSKNNRDDFEIFATNYTIDSYINDTTWINFEDILSLVPSIDKKEIKPSRLIIKKDSTATTLAYVLDIKGAGQLSPIEEVEAVIRKIIVNQRKHNKFDEIKNNLLLDAHKRKLIKKYNE